MLLRRAWCGGLGAAHLVEAQLTCFRSCSASCLFAFLALEHFSLQLQTVVSVSQKYEFFERAIRTDQPTTDQRISQDESAVFVGVFLYIYRNYTLVICVAEVCLHMVLLVRLANATFACHACKGGES